MKKLLKKGLAALSLSFILAFLPLHHLVAQQFADPLDWPSQCDKVEFSASALELQRIREISLAEASSAQIDAISQIAQGPRKCIFGPFAVLLHSPELLRRVQALGEHIRFNSNLPIQIREFLILITGRRIQSPYEWYIHEPIALRSGVSRKTVDQLSQNVRPSVMTDDQDLVYEFITQLTKKNMVEDTIYKHAVERFGEEGVIEIVALDNYFALLGHTLNISRFPVPAQVDVPFKAAWQ